MVAWIASMTTRKTIPRAVTDALGSWEKARDTRACSSRKTLNELLAIMRGRR